MDANEVVADFVAWCEMNELSPEETLSILNAPDALTDAGLAEIPPFTVMTDEDLIPC